MKTGLLLDACDDLSVKNGTLEIGEVDYQNINLILRAHEGEFKGYPKLGVGIEYILLDHDFPRFRRKITEQLESEGMRINSLSVNAEKVAVDANYR
jgi:hypothetical protein